MYLHAICIQSPLIFSFSEHYGPTGNSQTHDNMQVADLKNKSNHGGTPASTPSLPNVTKEILI